MARNMATTDAQWQAQRLGYVPGPWRERVRRLHVKRLEVAEALENAHQQSEARRLANLWLLETTGRMEALRVPVTLTDPELIDMANDRAKKAMSLAEVAPGVFHTVPGALRARLAGFVARYGIKAPGEEFDDGPAIARMICPLWWRRQLRKAQARALEAEAIRLGYVHRQGEIYASSVTVERRAQQKKRNAQALENTIATNVDTGQEFTLTELAARSVANPKIRRGELMTRIKGFEHIAQGMGHAAEFVTITCPSKYHPKRTGKNGRVIDNPKFEGATPRDAQKYLGKVWAQIRAKLARMGARVYGFRVTESHHDGTPHWHLLLFMEAHHVGTLRAVVRAYALREDGDEAGAQKNRCDFVSIDPAKGTAAGYIAKYISKNIDGGGYEVQGDVEGGDFDAITPSHRIEAWASTWGIRQFQQIGGPPVGVWRELRRMAEAENMGDTVKAGRAAADAGNWRRFVEVMGGPTVERKALPMRVAYTRDGERWDFLHSLPYEAPRTAYGEIAKGAIFGIRDCVKDRAHQSKRYRWKVERSRAAVAPWTRVNNCTEGQDDGRKSDTATKGGQGMDGGTGAYPGNGGAIHGADFGCAERFGTPNVGNRSGPTIH